MDREGWVLSIRVIDVDGYIVSKLTIFSFRDYENRCHYILAISRPRAGDVFSSYMQNQFNQFAGICKQPDL
jgi:hypothetical protein